MLDEILLGLLAGLRDDGSVSILIRARGADHGPDHVSIPNSRRDGLQHNGNDALASGIAVGPLVKAVGPAIRRQEVLVGQQMENGRVQQQVRTSDKRLSCMRYKSAFLPPVETPRRERIMPSLASLWILRFTQLRGNGN